MRLTEEVQRATRTANERARVSATDAATSAAKAAGYDAVKSERDELLRGMTPLEMAARDVARVNAKLTQKLVDVRYLAASLTYESKEAAGEAARLLAGHSFAALCGRPQSTAPEAEAVCGAHINGIISRVLSAVSINTSIIVIT